TGLAHVPVPLFAMTMGLAGLGLAWRAAAHVLAWPPAVGEAILALAALVFLATAILYGLKALRHPGAVAAEFRHPVRVNFFPTISISMMLLSVAAMPYAGLPAHVLGGVGAAAQFALAVVIFRRWIVDNIEIHQSSPAWFIPIVGNIVAPLGAVPLGLVEVGWFFFSIGIVLWGVLFPIMVYRIVFHHQMPAKFLPTLFVLLAPPAIGFLALLLLNGGVLDPLARVLFYVGLFLVAVLATMAPLFARVPFSLAWTAYTFPLAAMATAALRYHALVPGTATRVLAVVLLVVASAVIAVVATRVARAVAAGAIFRPEPE
ncbi:MAG: SLAC1 anion channel family protein, partial [Rhodobacterales bacterium]|nr:SLAC1 anion channel family protein [Rhodobacterales bacterium]